MKLLFPPLLILLTTLTTEAQTFYAMRSDRNLIAVAGLNTSTYYGDLKDDSDLIDAKPSLTVGLMTGITRKLYLRGEFSWITLSGSDTESSGRYRNRRNLSFVSNNYEFNISALINVVPNRGRFYQRSNFNFYGLVGVGGMYFNPKAWLNGEKYALQPLQTEGAKYSRFTFVIPLGIGARVKLTPFANLVVEAGWRKTFTDYIDDVSTEHIDNNSITDPIARQLADRRPEVGFPVVPAGTQRGNPSEKDSYMLLSAKIEYYLPYQLGTQNRKIYQRKRRATYR